jgi:uncharacterized protein YkwD
VLILGAGVLGLAGCGSGPDRASQPSSAAPSDPVAYAAQILRDTNDVRQARGLTPLGGSLCAQRAALQRAGDLVGVATLAHASLTGVIARCAPATTAAENLSRAAASPAAVIDAWMDSPGHRSNILDPGLTELGVGCVPEHGAMLCSQVYLGP